MNYSLLIGVVYPIVSHWVWTEDGWLSAGVTYTENGEDVTVHCQVSAFFFIDLTCQTL